MLEARKISLKEAPLIFNLWDNVYHQNAVKTLESNGRWDPSKLAKEHSAAKKKLAQKFGISDDEESDEEVCIYFGLFWSLLAFFGHFTPL